MIHRRRFLRTSLISTSVSLYPGWFQAFMKEASIADQSDFFLGADQSSDEIILFSNIPNSKNELIETPVWSFQPDFRPTDAKRLDQDTQISVLVASHGAIYKVPYNHPSKIVWAKTYSSCHSIEFLPDGNMISANSNDHKLTIHFNPTANNTDRIELQDREDYRFITAHGVVYDKVRKCVWAIGEVLGKFKYISSDRPQLQLLETYPLPYGHSDGHDLFPNFNDNLLITTHEGVLELRMGDFAYPIEKLKEKNVKSAVTNHLGELFITDPTDIDGYESWQTDAIVNVTTGIKLRRPGAKFYKVRLWKKNVFSY